MYQVSSIKKSSIKFTLNYTKIKTSEQQKIPRIKMRNWKVIKPVKKRCATSLVAGQKPQ